MINTHFADQPLLHEDLMAINATGRTLLSEQYVGDWQYLNMQALYGSAADVTGGYLVIELTWMFDQNTYGIGTGLGLRAQWLTTEYYTVYAPGLASNSYGHWCIPIKAPYVSIRVFRAGANNVSYHFMAQLSMRKLPFRIINDNAPLIFTSPNAAAGVAQRYDPPVTTYGRGFITGYLVNNTAGGIYVLQMFEINEDGAGEAFYYLQTPVGAAANSVVQFSLEVPLHGKALSFQGVYTGAGAGNFKVYAHLFPDS